MKGDRKQATHLGVLRPETPAFLTLLRDCLASFVGFLLEVSMDQS